MERTFAPLPASAQAMDGLSIVRAMMDGSLPGAPIAGLMGFSVTEAERGRVVLEGVPDARMLNPMGTVHGGYSATLLDSALTLVCFTHLEAGQGVTTLEFKLSFVRAVMPGMELRVEGRTLNVGRRVATSVAEMTRAGKLLVHATSTLLVV